MLGVPKDRALSKLHFFFGRGGGAGRDVGDLPKLSFSIVSGVRLEQPQTRKCTRVSWTRLLKNCFASVVCLWAVENRPSMQQNY